MTSAVQDGHGAPAQGVTLAPDTAEQLGHLYARIVESVQSVLYADDSTVQLAVGCLLAQGHLLVEDLPGLGKTTLAKALAHSLGLDFHRVQFTADLLPADVTGAMVLDRDRGDPVFRPGPIFTNVLMADELNRASARSQSALLEAMEERQVTADGTTMPLPRPFMVLATQNPFDAAGTSPLPRDNATASSFACRWAIPAGNMRTGSLSASRRRPRSTRWVLRSVDPTSRRCSAASATSTSLRPFGVTSSTSSRRAAPTPLWPWALRPAVRSRSGRLRVPWRWPRAATTWSPPTSKRRAEPALGHRLVLLPGSERSGTGIHEVVADLVHQIPLPGPETLADARTRS